MDDGLTICLSVLSITAVSGSLLLATDLRALSSFLFFVLMGVSCLRVQEFLGEIFKRSCVFSLFQVFRIGRTVLEGFPEEFGLCLIEEVAWREDHLELQVEVAVGHGIFVEGHAQFFDCFEFLVLQYFAGSSGDEVFLAIEVANGRGDSSHCLQKGDFLVVDEVCSSSLEDIMRKQVDPHIDVASHDARVLIALPIEDVVMGVRDTLLDGHFYYFLRLFHTLAFTAFAPVLLIHDHTHLVALLACCLNLRVHAWPQLSHLQDDAFTLAIGTRLGIGSTLSLAISADSHAGYLHFLHLSAEDLFQSDIDFDQLGLSLLGALVLLEEVVEGV